MLGAVRSGAVWYWSGLDRCGLSRCGLVRCGAAWCGGVGWYYVGRDITISDAYPVDCCAPSFIRPHQSAELLLKDRCPQVDPAMRRAFCAGIFELSLTLRHSLLCCSFDNQALIVLSLSHSSSSDLFSVALFKMCKCTHPDQRHLMESVPLLGLA